MPVEEVLEAARGLAREAGHGRVTDAHVVLALCARPSVREHLARRWLSVARLEDWARSTAADGARGYRESAEPAVPSELRATLEHARRRSILGRIFEPTANDMINALIARNGPARFEWDAAPIRRLHAAAQRMQKEARHRTLLIDHAFAALAADDERFMAACEAVGASKNAFRERLGARVSSALLATVEELTTFASLKSALVARRELAIDLVVVDLLRNPGALEIFAALGCSRDDFLFAYLHRRARPEPPSIAGRAEVVFYDDDVTTMKEVVAALEDVFGLIGVEAEALMWDVHEHGSASFVEDGRDAVGAIATCAEKIPTLRIELRAFSSASRRP